MPIGIALPTQSTRMLVAKRTSTLGHVSKCSASYKDLPLALLASPSYFFCAARQQSRSNSRANQGIAQKEKKTTDMRSMHDHLAGEETPSVQVQCQIISTGVEEPIV